MIVGWHFGFGIPFMPSRYTLFTSTTPSGNAMSTFIQFSEQWTLCTSETMKARRNEYWFLGVFERNMSNLFGVYFDGRTCMQIISKMSPLKFNTTFYAKKNKPCQYNCLPYHVWDSLFSMRFCVFDRWRHTHSATMPCGFLVLVPFICRRRQTDRCREITNKIGVKKIQRTNNRSHLVGKKVTEIYYLHFVNLCVVCGERMNGGHNRKRFQPPRIDTYFCVFYAACMNIPNCWRERTEKLLPPNNASNWFLHIVRIRCRWVGFVSLSIKWSIDMHANQWDDSIYSKFINPRKRCRASTKSIDRA